MYKTILAPLDGSKRAEAIIPHVEELARRHGAQVVLLRIVEYVSMAETGHTYLIERALKEFEQRVEAARSYLAIWEAAFREKGIEIRACVEQGPIVETITSVAEREGADLIVMTSHGRTGLSHVFYGSVAAGVLHRVARPLLLIRTRGES